MEKWASTNPLPVKYLITIQDGGIESLIYLAFHSKITPALQARIGYNIELAESVYCEYFNANNLDSAEVCLQSKFLTKIIAEVK